MHMKPNAYDFKEFYATDTGHVVERVIAGAITRLWPDMTGRRVMIYGFGMPYLSLFKGCERITLLMPPDQGGFAWPEDGKNLVALSARTELPIETNSLDGVILVHSLEFTNATQPHLAEVWRTLKSNGRLIVIVPNRIGFWSRVDWAPFGQGTPFSLSQVHRYLRETLFIPERHLPVLYAIPVRWSIFRRLAGVLERYMGYIAPALAGLHVVEASKQVYAGLAIPVRAAQRVPATVMVPTVPGAKFDPRESVEHTNV